MTVADRRAATWGTPHPQRAVSGGGTPPKLAGQTVGINPQVPLRFTCGSLLFCYTSLAVLAKDMKEHLCPLQYK